MKSLWGYQVGVMTRAMSNRPRWSGAQRELPSRGLGIACAVLSATVGSCGSPASAPKPTQLTTPKPAATTQPTGAPAASRETTSATGVAPGRPFVPPVEPMWLFGGERKTLKGWKVVQEIYFKHHGKVYVKDGTIVLEAGSPMTGISWTGEFPRDDYEVTLEAKRVEGGDFFCGMTFPVAESPCTLILGGWGGCVVGLSNIDGLHAAENETTTGVTFENGRWYRVRLRVTPAKIEVWIDDQQMIELARAGHEFTIWDEQDPVKPFGVATWYTTAALRNITLRSVRGR